MNSFDFANLLFSGPCNARCPTCIGKQIDPRLNTNNLNEYPPRNLERFLQMMEKSSIRQLVFTGTNTDPQLYWHEERLLDDFLQHCLGIGIRRVVLRKPYGERCTWEKLGNKFPPEFRYTGLYRNNPAYDYQGMEVTLWDFHRTDSTSINLFSTGLISTSYLLAQPV